MQHALPARRARGLAGAHLLYAVRGTRAARLARVALHQSTDVLQRIKGDFDRGLDRGDSVRIEHAVALPSPTAAELAKAVAYDAAIVAEHGDDDDY